MIVDPGLLRWIFWRPKKLPAPRPISLQLSIPTPLLLVGDFIFHQSPITMAKARVKKRTHTRPQNASAAPKGGAAALTKTPKSMVIRVGASQVGTSVTQLVKDVRRMMEPDTAVRLKVWCSNLLLWSISTASNSYICRNANLTDCATIL